jgi:hypothetical protein
MQSPDFNRELADLTICSLGINARTGWIACVGVSLTVLALRFLCPTILMPTRRRNGCGRGMG